jgi:hypothetical protein
MKNKKMKEYTTPRINEILIELEQGIAAGSATAINPDASNQVQSEWTIETDDSRVIPW